jgi:hypothetical protein
LGLERFEAGLEVRTRRHERALLAVAAARRELASPDLPDPAELRERWPTLGLHERRDLIGALIDCAFVLPPPGPAEKRLVVCGRGQAPDDLPASAAQWRTRSPRARPFDPAQCRGSIRLRSNATRRWSEQQVRAAVEPFLAGRSNWPTFPEFQAAGLGLVHRQIDLRGGPSLWARDYGLPRECLQYRLGAWSDDRIRHELKQFLAGRSDWPTKQEFDAAGKVTLRRVLDGFGGQERWAGEFGLQIPRQRRRLHSWTDEQIEAELRRFTAGTRRWPTRREFEEAGLRSLYNAIMCRGARKPLAKKLGLRVLPSYARLPILWSDQAIERALNDLLEGRDSWPTWTEFVAADLNRLYQAISRSPGGHDAWACRYGLPRPSRRRAQATDGRR